MNRQREIVNEYLARNGGDAQAALDELSTFLEQSPPMELEEFCFHQSARMILRKELGLEPSDEELKNDYKKLFCD